MTAKRLSVAVVVALAGPGGPPGDLSPKLIVGAAESGVAPGSAGVSSRPTWTREGCGRSPLFRGPASLPTARFRDQGGAPAGASLDSSRALVPIRGRDSRFRAP